MKLLHPYGVWEVEGDIEDYVDDYVDYSNVQRPVTSLFDDIPLENIRNLLHDDLSDL